MPGTFNRILFMAVDVYLEEGRKRVFASALDWPGWSRSGRDRDAALEALEAYRTRYRRATGASPSGPLRVVAVVPGTATTDFGAPDVEAPTDDRALTVAKLNGLLDLHATAWTSFEKAVRGARGKPLTLGPRGGGRQADAVWEHVFESSKSYLNAAGGSARGIGDQVDALQHAVREVLTARAKGVEVSVSARRTKPLWSPRYALRRSTWHVLDHLWEIEDRMP